MGAGLLQQRGAARMPYATSPARNSPNRKASRSPYADSDAGGGDIFGAVHEGNFKAVEALITEGRRQADANVRTYFSFNPRDAKPAASVNDQDQDGCTPLHIAAKAGNA